MYEQLARFAFVAFVGAFSVWYVMGGQMKTQISTLKAKHDQVLLSIAAKAASDLQARVQQDADIREAVHNLELHHDEEIAKSTEETLKLRACLNSGACRLRYAIPASAANVDPVQQAGPAAPVDDGTCPRPDAAVERNYIDLVNALNRQRAQINICQEYAKAIQK